MTDDLPLADFVPDPAAVAARISYLQLLQFQELSDLVTDAPALADKQTLGRVAGSALEHHELANAFLANRGLDAAAQLRRVAGEIDEFATRIVGRDWSERVITCYIATGIQHDFYALVLPALSDADAAALRPTIEEDENQAALHSIVAAVIEHDPTTGDRLAMWARRLVGDSLLACRRALDLEGERAEAIMDRVASELTADHSRRMNALGLAA